MATQANLNFVQQLYVAYYGRPAESDGQAYWAERADANGQQSIVEAFGNSEEYQNEFGDLESAELVNNLYQQLFGRDGDAEGVEYYAGLLDNNEKSLAEIALTIKNGAEGQDAMFFNARVAEAQRYTNESGDDYNVEAGRDAIEDISVPSDASLDFVQEMYVAYYGRPADSAGQRYWAEQADAKGQGAIINNFGDSQEYRDNFNGLDNRELVNVLYQQLFDRDGDKGGLDYYAGVLDRGEKSLAEIALTIKNGATGSDAEFFQSRVEAAQKYTDQSGDNYNLDDARDAINSITNDNTGGGDTGGGDTGGGDTGGGDTGGGDTGGGDNGGGDNGGGDTGGGGDNGGGDNGGGDTGGGDNGGGDNGGGDNGGGDNGSGQVTVEEAVQAYNDFKLLEREYQNANNELTKAFNEGASQEVKDSLKADLATAKANAIDAFTLTEYNPNNASGFYGELTGELEALEDQVEANGGSFITVDGNQTAVAGDGEEGGAVFSMMSEMALFSFESLESTNISEPEAFDTGVMESFAETGQAHDNDAGGFAASDLDGDIGVVGTDNGFIDTIA
nr:DUF4214 domain-containing protein [uncultured Halomonas sp.]